MRNKIVSFTRSQGGTIVTAEFELFEDELKNLGTPEKKEVFSKVLNKKIFTRAIKIGKIYAHSVFCEDGKVYDVNGYGFKMRGEVECIK